MGNFISHQEISTGVNIRAGILSVIDLNNNFMARNYPLTLAGYKWGNVTNQSFEKNNFYEKDIDFIGNTAFVIGQFTCQCTNPHRSK